MVNDNLFVIEGIDGSGKTTAIEILKQYFEDQGRSVSVLKGIGSGPVGSILRNDIVNSDVPVGCRAIYCAMCVIDCYKEAVEHLAQDSVVLIDRAIGSFFAYEVYSNGSPASMDIYRKILSNEHIFDIVPVRELYIKCSVETAKNRLSLRQTLSEIDQRPINYFSELIDGYDAYFLEQRLKGRDRDYTTVVEIDNDLISIEELYKKLLLAVKL